MTIVGYGTLQIIPSMRGMEAAINQQLGGITAPAGEKAGMSLSAGVKKGMLVAGGILAAGGVAAAKWGLDLAAANEQAEISFTTMLGSGQKAKVFLDELRAFAAKTPFEFPELQTAASSLISAGIEADKVIPIMTTLGDVTSGMGTGAEGVKRATVALQQMQAAGKITGEDLNQLRDAGIPVYDLLASSTGKAKDEVVALAQAGKLGKTELDQLMAGLESGKGLERFSGLMDKQSQSLNGLISTAKDVLGQGLATLMQPAVAELEQVLPKMLTGLDDVMAGAKDVVSSFEPAGRALVDFAGQVGPPAKELGDHLLPILGDVRDITLTVLPPALHASGAALGLLLKAAVPVADGIHDLTGYLADHEKIVKAVATAWGIWKLEMVGTAAWTVIAGALDTIYLKFLYLEGAIAGSAIVQGLTLMGTGFITMGTDASIGFGMVTEGATVAAGAISAVTLGLGGVAILGVAVMQGLSNAHAQAKSAISDVGEADPISIMSLNKYSQKLAEMSKSADLATDKGAHFMQSLKGTAEILTPMQNKVVDAAVAAGDYRKAFEIADEATRTYITTVNKIGRATGESGDEVQIWIRKLKLDPATMSVKDMATAITTAKNAAEHGTPATDELAAAYQTLADKTSASKDKIDAWKSALDAALGINLSVYDATTRFEDSLDGVTESSLRNGRTLDAGTEKGRANRDALSGAAKAAIDLSKAYADQGNMKAAALVLERNRRKIEDLGTSYGLSRAEIDDFLTQIGLTPELTKTQFELSGVEGAKTRLNDLNTLLGQMDGKQVTMSMLLKMGFSWGESAYMQLQGLFGNGPLAGHGNRWGGVEHYASGGTRQAMVGSGRNMVWWDEPETGGEAYIPRFGNQARSESIAAITAGWLGGRFVSAKELNKRRPIPALPASIDTGAPAAAGRASGGVYIDKIIAQGQDADSINRALVFHR